MIRHALTASILILAIAVPVQTMARPVQQGDGYAGIQHSRLTFKSDRLMTNASPSIINLRAGYFPIEYFSVEGRFGIGYDDSSARRSDGETVRVDVERFMAAYGTAHLPLGKNSSFYGFAGYSEVSAEFDTPERTFTDSKGGASFGVGYTLNLTSQFGLNMEYANYLDKSGHRLGGYTVGALVYF